MQAYPPTPEEKLLMTPMQRRDPMAASTAFPPRFSKSTPTLEHNSCSAATAALSNTGFKPNSGCPTNEWKLLMKFINGSSTYIVRDENGSTGQDANHAKENGKPVQLYRL